MTNEKDQKINEEELEASAEQENSELTDESAAEAIFEGEENDGQDESNPYEEEIRTLKMKLEEAENRSLRLQADFENTRRRMRLDMEAIEKYRAQKLITDLLPALDNFERALQMEADNDQTKSLLQGMEMVYRSILEAIKKEGVEVIDALNKEFDPHLHQAVMQAEDENYGSNIVIQEFQKGYMLKDRVIRPSMVKVNQ